MRNNLIGILLCILTLASTQKSTAQLQYPPDLYSPQLNGSPRPYNVLSVPLNNNPARCSLNYTIITPAYPGGSDPEDYQPLDVFWEFIYANGFKEYNFQRTPTVDFYRFPSSAPDVTVRAWSIDKYDDWTDDPPPRSWDFTVTPIVGAGEPIPRAVVKPSIRILPSWDPSPGDTIIYIIRLEVDCKISDVDSLFFFYDNSMADLVDATLYPNTNDKIDPAPNQAGSGVVKWDLPPTDLQKGIGTYEAYKDFYVQLEMKNNAPIGKEFACSARFVAKSNEVCPPIPGVSRQDTVDISHDPNYKYVISPRNTCLDIDDNQIKIEYRIEYQNIGPGGADEVTVVDFLDEKEHIEAVRFIGAKHKSFIHETNFNALGLIDIPTDGYLHWYFAYPNTSKLRGMGETDYSRSFWDDATKGWIDIEVTYNKSVLQSCNAIMNHARITFDCNPEYYTTTSIAEICCYDSELPAGESNIGLPISSDNGCELFDGQVLFSNQLDSVIAPVKNYQLTSAQIDNITSNFPGQTVGINWYPDRWITSGNTLNAVLNPLEDITYTLVVSSEEGDSTCARLITTLHINVDNHGRVPTKPMRVFDDANSNDCTSTPIIIGGSPPYTYLWENGSTSSSQSIFWGTRNWRLTVTDNHNACDPIIITTAIKCTPRWYELLGIALVAGLLLWGLGRLILRRNPG